MTLPERNRTDQNANQQRKEQSAVTALGYTSVILVINMRQFIAPESQGLFDSVRGSEVFSRVLREDWPQRLRNSKLFIPSSPELTISGDDVMSVDETGFMTGIFRQNILNYYSAPDYRLNKAAFDFPAPLMENLQFSNVYEPIWDSWEIYLRPTMTGMFMLRVVRPYTKAVPLRNIAQDVIKLQMSFDIHSALDELRRLDENFSTNPREFGKKRASVQALFDWMRIDPQHPPTLRYTPVQWQLAMDVGRNFVREIGEMIDLKHKNTKPIQLREPEKGSQPIFDSYMIYHLDKLLTVLPKLATEPGSKDTPLTNTSRDVTPKDLEYYDEIRQNLVNLLEGAMLRKITPPQRNGKNSKTDKSRRYFPTHTKDFIDDIFASDMSTWQDELCVMQSRSALIVPARRSMNAELFISNLPTKTDTNVTYAAYWQALERMIEFVVEIRVLAQLLEHDSTDLLQKFVTTLRLMREDMLNDQVHIDRHRGELTDLVNASANLSRLVSVAQSMSNPQVWSRAEYGADKAEYLVQAMKIDVVLGHTERNVGSLTSLVNHVDELYLAGLSEDNNRETFWMSLALAALSFSIILFSLPSFWADIKQLNPPAITDLIVNRAIPLLTIIGSILAPVIILISMAISLTSAWRTYRTRRQRHYRREGISQNQV
ncbi:MAG: hypothetical protein H7Y09_11610 [Chitinophagaceae bacterium]|nr:hypothetical protein [Anaerolineae bacterium]